jgi:hypothetical protein
VKKHRFLLAGLAGIFCVSANAVPPTPQQQAFAQGQALANGGQAGAAATVSGGGVAATVNKFNPTYYNSSGNAPESALFQGGNGQPAGNGTAKVNNCQTGAPNPDKFLQQNCDAINFMAKNPTTRPHIALPPSMFAPSKAIMANAPALAAGNLGIANPNAVGGFTGCTNQTTTPPPTLEICREFTGTAAQQCTFGRVVLADRFTEYHCDKTNDVYMPQSCDKTVNVSVVQPVPVPPTIVTTNSAIFKAPICGSGNESSFVAAKCQSVGMSPVVDACDPRTQILTYHCSTTTYTCPTGFTSTGSGTGMMCIGSPVISTSINNGCATQQAAAL